MKRIAAFALPVVIALLASAAHAADKEIPQGLRKIAFDRLPEIASLPGGTFEVEFEATWIEGGKVFRTKIEAQSKKTGISMKLRTKPRKSEQSVFADVAGGPMASARAALLAIHNREFQKLRDLVEPAEADKAIEEVRSNIESIETRAGAAQGITLKRIADEFLASVTLTEPSSAFKISYAALVESGGVRGKLEIGFKMLVVNAARPRWVLSDAEFEFRPIEEDGENEEAFSHALPDGLRAFVGSCGIPDLSDFPAGTDEIGALCVSRISGNLCETEAGFARSGNGYMLMTLSVGPAEEDDETFCPDRPIAESPVDSVRKVMKAFRAGDLDGLLPYMPGEMKEMVADPEFREMFTKQMVEEFQREEKKKGYAPDTAILNALPSLRSALFPCARFRFSFKHPVRVKDKDGLMDIEMEFIAEKGNQENFVMKDMDAVFKTGDEDEDGDPEKAIPGGDEED